MQIVKASAVENSKTNPEPLTADVIDRTADGELQFAVFQNLSAKLKGPNRKETFQTFSKGQKAIYVLWILEAEINNGGFNQYYFNSSRDHAGSAPDALRLVGAAKFADLVERANGIYEAENKTITEHLDGTIEGFSASYKNNPLERLDKEFYQLSKVEDLLQLQVDFIRRNKADFIDA